MINTGALKRPGDILIEDIRLVSYTGFEMSLKGIYATVELYEDVYSNSLSGFITLMDALNICKHVPIIGQEQLRIIYRTPGADKPISVTLRVYKISNISQTKNHNARLVSLELMSDEFFLNNQIRISKSYSKVRYSDIVQSIFSDYLQGSKVATIPTWKERSVVIPRWTPFYALNWLANRSSMESNPKIADYCFWQSIDGDYAFSPLSILKNLPAVASYTYYPAGMRLDTGERNMEREFYNARDSSILDIADKARDVMLGTFSNNTLVVDPFRKKYAIQPYIYSREYQSVPHVAPGQLVPPSPADIYSKMIRGYEKLYPKHSFMFDDEPDTDTIEKIMPHRQALMQQMQAIQLQLEIPGNSDLRAGQIIDLALPSPEDSKRKADWKDTYLSGRYMIVSARHSFSDRDYSMTLHLAKDSYEEDLPSIKPPLDFTR